MLATHFARPSMCHSTNFSMALYAASCLIILQYCQLSPLVTLKYCGPTQNIRSICEQERHFNVCVAELSLVLPSGLLYRARRFIR